MYIKLYHQAGVTAPATKFPMHRSSVDSGTKRMKRKDMSEKMLTSIHAIDYYKRYVFL
jgi:hypothetical protein